METLEHCLDGIVEVVLADLARLCAPTGRVVISVPIETGLTFMGKSVIRKLAAIRGLSDYRHYESYTLKDALKMVFATAQTHVERPVYGEEGATSHSHYGFIWQRLRNRVEAYFQIDQICFSPLAFLGGFLSSQVWFVCSSPGVRRQSSGTRNLVP